MTLTDEQILEKARPLVQEYKHRLGLDDWHVELELVTQGDPTCMEEGTDKCHAGKIIFDRQHREAKIELLREVAGPHSGVGIPYLVGHELGHLLSLPFEEMVNRVARLTPEAVHPAVHALLDEQWDDATERLAHFTALALGAKLPPADFWVTEQKGYGKSTYHS